MSRFKLNYTPDISAAFSRGDFATAATIVKSAHISPNVRNCRPPGGYDFGVTNGSRKTQKTPSSQR